MEPEENPNYPFYPDTRELPPVLYHYTSQVGLLGIVSTRSMWATDIRYLNDSSEYIYGYSLIQNVLKNLRKGSRGSKRAFWEEFDKLNLLGWVRSFVISLTEEPDLLNQWRAYTPRQGGYSIGFDVHHLQTILDTRENDYEFGLDLIKCVYDPPEQEETVRRYFDEMSDGWKQATAQLASRIKPNKDDQEKGDTNETEGIMVIPRLFSAICSSLIPAFKNETFRDEKEWRIVLRPSITSFGLLNDTPLPFAHGVKLRHGISTLIPYIEVPLTEQENESEPQSRDHRHSIPIKSITVGPTPHPELACEAAGILLHTNGVHVKVDTSVIPFRSW